MRNCRAERLENINLTRCIVNMIITTNYMSDIHYDYIVIGAGSAGTCQLLNGYDLIGALDTFKPKFAKRYGNIAEVATNAFAAFAEDVRSGAFPDEDHSYTMTSEEAEKLARLLADSGN